MAAKVTSAFLYVEDVVRTIEFYHEVLGAEVRQLHPDDGSPITLAILRVGDFGLMIHPKDEHAEEFADQKPGVGIHLQLRVDDIDAFHGHCIEQGAMLALSGEPVDQEWGWRELALKDPDGYIWSVYQDLTEGQWS